MTGRQITNQFNSNPQMTTSSAKARPVQDRSDQEGRAIHFTRKRSVRNRPGKGSPEQTNKWLRLFLGNPPPKKIIIINRGTEHGVPLSCPVKLTVEFPQNDLPECSSKKSSRASKPLQVTSACLVCCCIEGSRKEPNSRTT